MKIQPTRSVFQQTKQDLLKGDTVKAAPTQVDKVDEVNAHGVKKNHRVSLRHEKELGIQVVHIVDNATGETVRKSHSDAQIDQQIRMKRLVGLHVDEDA